jgi:hypothetical protein
LESSKSSELDHRNLVTLGMKRGRKADLRQV